MTSQRAHTAVTSARRPGPAHAAPGTRGAKYGPWLRALVAAVAATVLVIARWETWAKHNIGNFILVGRHFANPAQVPRGIPIQPTYGYDGQYFYRLALDPADLSHTAFGISVDHSYRFMRIGYPVLTWLLSGGQHSVVPDVLIIVNILAVGAAAATRCGACWCRATSGSSPASPATPPSRSPPPACWRAWWRCAGGARCWPACCSRTGR
jgi:hypothetical protein